MMCKQAHHVACTFDRSPFYRADDALVERGEEAGDVQHGLVGVRATPTWLRRAAALDAQICHDESRPCAISQKSARRLKGDGGGARAGPTLVDTARRAVRARVIARRPRVLARLAQVAFLRLGRGAKRAWQARCRLCTANGTSCACWTDYALVERGEEARDVEDRLVGVRATAARLRCAAALDAKIAFSTTA